MKKLRGHRASAVGMSFHKTARGESNQRVQISFPCARTKGRVPQSQSVVMDLARVFAVVRFAAFQP